MAIQKVSVWDARLADVTSEDCMEGMGRWKGILNINYNRDQFAGRCWVMYDIPDESVEYASLTAMAQALGWTIEEYEDHLSGPFDTSKAGAIGKRPVMHIDAEMYVADEDKTDDELINELRRWSNDNDRLLGSHFSNSINELTNKSNFNDLRLGAHIESTVSDLRQELSAVDTRLESQMGTAIEGLRQEITEKVSRLGDSVRICKWSFGQYSVGSGMYNNILYSAPSNKVGDTAFTYSSNNKSFTLNAPHSGVDRILRVTVCSDLSLASAYTGHTSMHIRTIGGETLAEQIVFMNRQHGVEQAPKKVVYSVELFLSGQDASAHPVYTDGLRIEFGNSAGQQYVIYPGDIMFTLLSI